MAVVPKAIYMFNAITITTMVFFIEIESLYGNTKPVE
jgi:hypothetical protein